MSYWAYKFILKRKARSLKILLNKEEINLLKLYFIYIKRNNLVSSLFNKMFKLLVFLFRVAF